MTSGDPRAVGELAPAFSGTLVNPDGTIVDRSLSDLLDRPVLLCFYTMDFSPDCVQEWCSFRDYDWFASGGQVRVVGVSKSGPRLHRRFINHLDLGFPLYADSSLEIADAFGVTYRALGVSKRSRRSCFLVDTDRTIRYRWLGEHWFDPTRDVPPVDEIHETIVEELDLPAAETFGF